MNDAASPPTPSSADLREAARRLAIAEADGIHNEDDARAVANVATWLHAMADDQDAAIERQILDNLRAQRRQHIEAELARISSAPFLSPSVRDAWNAA